MTKIVKTKTTSYNVLQVGVDMFIFNKSYKRIRGGAKYKGFQCYLCNQKFKDDEKISLAITDKGNKTLCHSCALELKKELEDN